MYSLDQSLTTLVKMGIADEDSARSKSINIAEFDELLAEETIMEGSTTLQDGGPKTATAEARESATRADFQRRVQQRRGDNGGSQ